LTSEWDPDYEPRGTERPWLLAACILGLFVLALAGLGFLVWTVHVALSTGGS
jgi:hypothetical protein